MKWKVKSIAAAALGVALIANGSSALAAGTDALIDNGGCGILPNGGLGEETCETPSPLPGEGVMTTAAEQAISIFSVLADALGCPAIARSGSVPVSIRPKFTSPQQAETTVGAAKFDTIEVANTDFPDSAHFRHNGVRQYETSLASAGDVVSGLFGDGLTALEGTYIADAAYSILHGASEFTHSGSRLEERVIKDFYLGVAIPPTFAASDDPTGPPVPCSESDFLAGTCVVRDAGNYDPSNPFELPHIIRDNGLEVTTKRHSVANLGQQSSTDPALLLIGHPKGKWRQISYYRRPTGGNGQLTYTKVRIAPFNSPDCVMQLNGTVTGTISFPEFSGTLIVFPLGS